MSGAAPLLDLLRSYPLPAVDGDKTSRGNAVLVAGSVTCPGAAVLAATAALRAGAGRVQVVTAPEVSTAVALAVPEALVVGWDGTAPIPPRVRNLVERAGAVAVGPGMEDGAAAVAELVAEHVPSGVHLLADAGALSATRRLIEAGVDVVVAPNGSEASRLLADGVGDGRDVEDGGEVDVASCAQRLAQELGRCVAVRDRSTAIASEEGVWCVEGARGLGTAGSGDVFAGMALGLLARGIEVHVAIGWAVACHRWAGARLAGDRANPGYLARQLVDLFPEAAAALAP